jgi:putative transposase
VTRSGRGYPSDLSDQQWKLISKFIPKARAGGRPRTTDVRGVLSAIFYVNRTGCAWRYLPREYPAWQTVYMYYRQWKQDCVLNQIHLFLVKKVRRKLKRNESPSTLIVDSQSSKAHFGEARGYDGFKKVRGRKRTLFIDTLGLIHSVRVCGANRGDPTPATEMLDRRSPYFPSSACASLQALYADLGYRGKDFQKAAYKSFKVRPTLNKSKNKVTHGYDSKGKWWVRKRVNINSNLKPVRWKVERTFAWFNYYRRLARDYERTVSSSEAMIRIAMMRLMLNRLNQKRGTYRRWE